MRFSQIFADLLERCDGVPAPRPWSRFSKGHLFWRLPTTQESILNTMRSKHSDQKLIRSGVAARVDERLVFHPLFSTFPGAIFPVRSAAGQAPLDLLTDQGSLRGRLPIRSAIEDYQVRTGIEASGRLFAACCMADVVRLRSIGLAAAPAMGLERLTVGSIRQIRYMFGMAAQKPPAVPHSLILLGWSPGRFSSRRPPLLDQVVRSLTDNASCLGIPLFRIAVWSPSPSELKDIASCLRYGRRDHLENAVISSLEQDCQPLSIDPSEPDPRSLPFFLVRSAGFYLFREPN